MTLNRANHAALQLTLLALCCIKQKYVSNVDNLNFEDVDRTVGKHFFLISHQLENIAHVHFNLIISCLANSISKILIYMRSLKP